MHKDTTLALIEIFENYISGLEEGLILEDKISLEVRNECFKRLDAIDKRHCEEICEAIKKERSDTFNMIFNKIYGLSYTKAKDNLISFYEIKLSLDEIHKEILSDE